MKILLIFVVQAEAWYLIHFLCQFDFFDNKLLSDILLVSCGRQVVYSNLNYGTEYFFCGRERIFFKNLALL
jgi:hypothetical protein